jgi:hypothetical protein
VSHSYARAGIPAIQRSYATIPTVTSPAQPPAVQRQEKKGVMDFVLTSADAVTPNLNDIDDRL